MAVQAVDGAAEVLGPRRERRGLVATVVKGEGGVWEGYGLLAVMAREDAPRAVEYLLRKGADPKVRSG